MNNLKELLQKRKEIKRKKPDFIMQDAHKIKCLPKHWRKPRGIDSKIRLNLKGYNKRVQIGYGSPKEVKGLHPTGLAPIWIANVNDLLKIDKTKEGAIIVTSVGSKKRVEIIKKAKELEVKILNIKDGEKFIQSVTNEIKLRKEEKEKKNKKKTDKKAKEDKKKEDKLVDKVLSEEEKAAEEKREKDKLLIKKEI